MPAVVVLQGFGVFGTHRVNPSERLVTEMAARYPKDRAAITGRVLTTAADALDEIPALMDAVRPAVYLGVGLAYGRSAVAVERVAINMADYAIPDESGARLGDAPIALDGPVGYWSTLPLAAIRAAWKAADIPGYISNSAGTFLCNHSFYLAAHTAATRGLNTRVGFIHVPALVEQVRSGSEPALPYRVLYDALQTALDVIVSAPRPVPDGPESVARLVREP